MSSIKGFLLSKVVFHQRSSSIKGHHLPSNVFSHQRLSSIKGSLPSKVVSKVVFHQRFYSIKLSPSYFLLVYFGGGSCCSYQLNCSPSLPSKLSQIRLSQSKLTINYLLCGVPTPFVPSLTKYVRCPPPFKYMFYPHQESMCGVPPPFSLKLKI